MRRNDAEALRWFRRAARGRELCAVMNLGRFYGDHGNHRRAMFWHQRAVSWGDGDALVEVGRGYYNGLGVRRDPTRGVRCFRSAIRECNITGWGRQDAIYGLALAFHEGLGVRKSDDLALKWALRANVDDDHADARALIEALRRTSLRQ